MSYFLIFNFAIFARNHCSSTLLLGLILSACYFRGILVEWCYSQLHLYNQNFAAIFLLQTIKYNGCNQINDVPLDICPWDFWYKNKIIYFFANVRNFIILGTALDNWKCLYSRALWSLIPQRKIYFDMTVWFYFSQCKKFRNRKYCKTKTFFL